MFDVYFLATPDVKLSFSITLVAAKGRSGMIRGTPDIFNPLS
jgi:hypothetical protein